MKKNYVIPATNIIMVETASMIAESLQMNTSSTDEVVTSQEELLSRESVWDD